MTWQATASYNYPSYITTITIRFDCWGMGARRAGGDACTQLPFHLRNWFQVPVTLYMVIMVPALTFTTPAESAGVGNHTFTTPAESAGVGDELYGYVCRLPNTC